MAFKNLTDNLNDLVQRVEDYGSSMAEYSKLRLFKSTTKASVSLVNLLIYGSLSLFVMLFLSIGAALWLATFFDNPYSGFLLIGAFYGILLIFMFIYGRKIIERSILYKFSDLFYDENDPEPRELAHEEVRKHEQLLRENALKKSVK